MKHCLVQRLKKTLKLTQQNHKDLMMTENTNFRVHAPYFLKVYDDNSVEWFNRLYLPIGIENKNQLLEVAPDNVELSKCEADKLRKMCEQDHGEERLYLYDSDMKSPNLPERSKDNILRYFKLKNKVESIILDL